MIVDGHNTIDAYITFKSDYDKYDYIVRTKDFQCFQVKMRGATGSFVAHKGVYYYNGEVYTAHEGVDCDDLKIYKIHGVSVNDVERNRIKSQFMRGDIFELVRLRQYKNITSVISRIDMNERLAIDFSQYTRVSFLMELQFMY